MAVVARLTVVAVMLVFMPPPALLTAKARISFPAPAVLRLERTLHLNGTAIKHLIQQDMARHKRGLLGEPQGTSIGVSQLLEMLINKSFYMLWVPCTTCSNCPTSSAHCFLSQQNSYDPSQSRTSSVFACSDDWCQDSIRSGFASCDPESQDGRCGYNIIYGSGSTIGYYISDEIHFDMVNGQVAGFSSSVIFGCSNVQSGGLAAADLSFDGILGVGPNRQSVNSQLNSMGLVPMVFSLCLKSSDSGSGILVLGEAVEPGMVYTPLVSSMYHYGVYLESIAVNGEKLPIDPSVFNSHNRRTYFDSGTALAYLPDDAYETFLTAIYASVSLSPLVAPVMNNGEHCFATSSSLDLSFPPVTLHFTGGAEMKVMPWHYLLPQGLLDERSLFCLGWKRHVGRPQTILGDIVLMDKLIVHDVENRRLGWVDYDCTQTVNITTSNHWNKTSNKWNKRQGNSGHKSLDVMIPIGVAVIVTFIFVFGGQYP